MPALSQMLTANSHGHIFLQRSFLCCLRSCEDPDEECDDRTSFEGEIPIGAYW
ncbi:hypothetical protein BDV24DRAFT_145792 [Aspergillus arachidicola]|uniref:Uncharacterized protein n=1 Tax=Aspergillus arachidicola TaxID=656916 RepID=A0A5N6XSD3_9EURO|nr:hypothetical protein BDV24DRAFT_145792 [Aspergillus arachidicola]